jgi:hypothetical protein
MAGNFLQCAIILFVVEMKCLALDYVSEEHLLPAGIVSELHPNLTLYFNRL